MVNPVLKTFLEENNVDYRIVPHRESHSALKDAQAAHISGHHVAKTVMVDVDGNLCMCVLPATHLIDFLILKNELGAEECRLVGEMRFQNAFEGVVEVGAMSPFGNIHHMPVYVSRSLVQDGRIAFNAGSHREMVEMSYWDFDRLVSPKLLNFSHQREELRAA